MAGTGSDQDHPKGPLGLIVALQPQQISHPECISPKTILNMVP